MTHYFVAIAFRRMGLHILNNFGPYYNEKKPIIEPNKSFDLCRLACSLFDFICDDINNVNEYRKDVKIYDLIFSWIYDDNGRNVLYKSNGEDKYPGFKLYKMISKLVHNHIPLDQVKHSCFDKYTQSGVENINNYKINIDDLIARIRNQVLCKYLSFYKLFAKKLFLKVRTNNL